MTTHRHNETMSSMYTYMPFLTYFACFLCDIPSKEWYEDVYRATYAVLDWEDVVDKKAII
jgi:hypothetical protein